MKSQIIFIFLLILSIQCNQEIKNPLRWELFHSDTYKATTADVYYKDHIINQKYFIFRLDLNSPYTDIGSNENDSNIKGEFIFGNLIIKMPVFYVNKKYENYENDDLDSVIGLNFPKDESEEKTNFLTNLKKQNIIQAKIFSLTKSKNNSDKIDILFGTIPKVEINSDKNHLLICPMINKKFECNFKNILIDGFNINYDSTNLKFSFSLNERYIVCPLKFLNFLNIALLKDIETSEKCKFSLINEFSYSIICENDIYKNLKDIKLIVDNNNEIIFETKNLFFQRKDKKYQFIMIAHKNDNDDNNNFIFGYNFFTIFDGIVDLDREILGIYHNKYIKSINKYDTFNINYPIEIKNIQLNNIKIYSIFGFIVLLLFAQILCFKFHRKKFNEKNKVLIEQETELEEI